MTAAATKTLPVEVVFALPGQCWRRTLAVEPGTTAGELLVHSGLAEVYRQQTGMPVQQFGVFGRRVNAEHVMQAGERLELYRPLEIDPRARRRKRAAAGHRDGDQNDSTG